MGEIQVDERLSFNEEPIEVMEEKVKKLRKKKVAIVKIRSNTEGTQVYIGTRGRDEKEIPTPV
jgi:hypothetical protein